MTEILTAAQMRAIEAAAIAAGETTGLAMMERAGEGVVAALLDWRPAGTRRATVLCGPGNNGGDGFVVARLLHERGWEVAVHLHGRAPEEIGRLPADAATNAARWAALGPVRTVADLLAAPPEGGIAVDALFGTGLTRPLDATALAALRALGGCEALVAVDLPSGICSDSGRVLGEGGAEADLTVTFHAPKRGHVLAEGAFACGTLRVAEIGLDHASALQRLGWIADPATGRADRLAEAVWLTERSAWTGGQKGLLDKAVGGGRHKYDHGHAVVLAGGPGRGGAARLAARAALRSGAGLVTVLCPPAALIENAARLDAVMLRSLAGPEALAEVLADRRIGAICLGPGLGVGARTRTLVAVACRADPPRAVVLDADALTSFADAPETLWSLTHPGCVLTPHDGEFARLFPDLAAPLRGVAVEGPAPSRIEAVRAGAARAGCTVLLKGPDTIIAEPGGEVHVNSAHRERSVPWLATAGSGDVLAGLITGLLARCGDVSVPVRAAAWLHVEAARRFGPGLIAEDLPEALPGVFRDLGL